jgi:cobalt/nickel transport protein
MRTARKLWIGLAILIVLSPLGLLIPAWLGGGTAWGEWSAEELQKLTGYLPSGMRHLDGLWRAPLPDYALPGQGEAKPAGASAAYILSAVVGALIVTVLAYGLGRLLSRREEASDDT